jgi:hypothetical protein
MTALGERNLGCIPAALIGAPASAVPCTAFGLTGVVSRDHVQVAPGGTASGLREPTVGEVRS